MTCREPKQENHITKTNLIDIKINDDISSTPVDVLIIGNSHTKNLIPSKIYKYRSCKVHTLPRLSRNIDGAHEYLKSCNFLPKIIVLHVADNDLVNDNSVDGRYTYSRLTNLIKQYRKKFIDAEIIISSVLPRALGSTQMNKSILQKVNAFNRDMEIYMGEINMIHHPELCSVSASCFVQDRIHMSPLGLKYFVRNMKHVTNRFLGMYN